MRGRYLPLATVCLVLVGVADARAHFLFIHIGPPAEAGRSAEVYFSEQAQAGDPTDDATVLWPEDRPVVELGRLEVTGISPTSAADERRLIFDPTNRTDGIDLSADPILLARSAAYAISYDRRSKGE